MIVCHVIVTYRMPCLMTVTRMAICIAKWVGENLVMPLKSTMTIPALNRSALVDASMGSVWNRTCVHVTLAGKGMSGWHTDMVSFGNQSFAAVQSRL